MRYRLLALGAVGILAAVSASMWLGDGPVVQAQTGVRAERHGCSRVDSATHALGRSGPGGHLAASGDFHAHGAAGAVWHERVPDRPEAGPSLHRDTGRRSHRYHVASARVCRAQVRQAASLLD